MHTSFLVGEGAAGLHRLRCGDVDQGKASRAAFPLPPHFRIELHYEVEEAAEELEAGEAAGGARAAAAAAAAGAPPPRAADEKAAFEDD